MRTFLFSLIVLILSIEVDAQMRKIYLDTLHENNHINKISFYSSSQGYVGFTDWIGFTSDSGRSFVKKYITYYNVDFNGYYPSLALGVSGIKAFSQNELIVYGDYGFVPSILYSSDGGNTFKLVYYSQANSQQLTDGVADMIFPQGNTIGFAVDADRILKTVNGGKNWSIIRLDPNSFFDHIEAIDNNTIFVSSTYPSKLLKSTDGGVSWQQVPLPVNPLKAINFVSSTNGWINGGEGATYYTSNTGTIWTLKNNTNVAPFYTGYFKFLDDSMGYALGGQYNVYKTTDSGKIWEQLPRDNNYAYLEYSHSDLFFLNKNQFWAGGLHGFLELTTNAGGAPLPAAYFRIDTANLSVTNTVNLVNLSKTNHQFKWLKNDVLISSTYIASYIHNPVDSFDLIKLVATEGSNSDTMAVGQYFNIPPPPPVPTITSFGPIVATEGTIVSINGTNFKGVTSVKFGGTDAVAFTVISPNLIQAVVGKGASGDISVTTPYGTATISGFEFTTLLTVTSISPSEGPAGTIVTINGTEFNSNPQNNIVYFGAVRAQVLTASNSQITVIAPPGQSYRPITVTTNGFIAYAPSSFMLTFPYGDSITVNTFTTRMDSTGDSGGYFLRSTDFDNDGKPDIVTSNFSYYYRVGIHRNTSKNDSVSFDPVKFFDLGTGGSVAYNGIALGDMNGDGKIDIIGQGNSNLVFLKNTSTPGNISFDSWKELDNTHNYAPEFFDIIDLDGDGKPEPFGVAGTALGTFKNVSVGDSVAIATVGYYKLSESTYGMNSTAADLDGDRKPEIIFSAIYNHDWSLYVHKNISNGGVVSFKQIILPISCAYAVITSGDFDKDGKVDLALTGNGIVTLLKNTSSNGNISFSSRIDFALSANARSIATSDINGDGKLDLVLNVSSLQIAVMENTSNGGTISFGPPVVMSFVEPVASSDICLADYNLDGKTDIGLVAQNIKVLLNQSGIVRIRLCENSDTTLSINIAGNNYQWQKNSGNGFVDLSDGSNFSGAHSASLHITAIPLSWSNYQFRCIVDNKTNKVFLLETNPVLTPSVSISSSDTSVCGGQMVSFAASVLNAGGTATFQWMVNDKATGTNSSTLGLDNLNDSDKVALIIRTAYGCATSSEVHSNEIFVRVKLNPSANAGNDQTICMGQKATIGTNASENSYSWTSSQYNFTSNEPKDTVAPMTTTLYYLTVTNPLGCSSKDTVVVVVSTPIAEAGPDEMICSGGVGALIGGPLMPNSTYSWSPSTGLNLTTEAQVLANPPATTTYVLTVVSQPLSCIAKDTITVFVTQNSAPTISTTGSTTFCQGVSVSLSSSAAADNQWYRNDIVISGAVSTTYTATQQGNYTVKYIAAGCVSEASVPVSVVVNPIPSTPIISVNGNVLTSSAPSGNQWYLNGVAIQGAVGTRYTATMSGDYSVNVTSNGCSSSLSTAVTVSITAINSPSFSKDIFIAPNPVKDKLKIWYIGTGSKFRLYLFDITGANILKDVNFTSKVDLDMSLYSKGVYLIKIVNSKGEQIEKLVSKL